MKWITGAGEMSLRVNGRAVTLTVHPGDTLLHAVRDGLGLTGPKAGCENGDCGACTMLLDGVPVKSCMVPAAECAGREVVTVEGLEDSEFRRSFEEESSFQCGFCASGFLVNMHALLRDYEDPDDDTIRRRLQGNLCRCTGYAGIRRGLERYIQKRLKDHG